MRLIIAVAIGAALTIAGRLADLAWLVWLFKPLTTIAILVAAWMRRAHYPAYAWPIIGGLTASLIGDVLLIPPGLFVFGLVAFLIAHVFYLYAFTRDTKLFADRSPLVLVAVIALTLMAVLWPRLPGGLRVPVVCYVAMLGSMAAQAIGRGRTLHSAPARLAGWGGALFMTSDALLAFDKFHSPLPLAEVWILATYYVAQTTIALSIAPPAAPARA